MALGILVLLTALSISAVAIYYSVAGLVAIFAAAAVPIMIMGGVLEVGKLVTAVWLHRYWKQATWWLKTYLATAVVVLMFITSMGIFGFLSKAHIEQTAQSIESVEQVSQIEEEIARLEAGIIRSEQKITKAESSTGNNNDAIQAQIDKEQERIDSTYERIQPAIDEQNQIIQDARTTDATRTKPYEDQLTNIQNEITRLENTAKEYEDKIANLNADTSAVQPLLDQIKNIEEEIIRVTNQLQSTERSQIRAGQAIIGVSSDGLFGNNTREALAKWVSAQQDRISQIQSDISKLRTDATTTVDNERQRLANVIKDIRDTQIPALKDREVAMLDKIEEVRSVESPIIQTARDEISRIRSSADEQIKASQLLIQSLRNEITVGLDNDSEQIIETELGKIRTAENTIDTLTEEKYALEAEYRKLEAEVGPVKYLAEFIYGEQADANLLEEAVRWVIVVIIFVFDPLAVLLLIASQYTFEFRNKKLKDDSGERLRREWQDYEQARAQKINDNPGFDVTTTTPHEEKVDDERGIIEDVDSTGIARTNNNGGDTAQGLVVASAEEGQLNDGKSNTTTNADMGDVVPETGTSGADAIHIKLEQPEVQVDEKFSPAEQSRRIKYIEDTEDDEVHKAAKALWKESHPDDTIKRQKELYIHGRTQKLPWESETYQQNAEQNENSIWNRIDKNDS